MVRGEGAEPAAGGRAGGGLVQTPRPLVRIRVYLRTCFLTQVLSQPRQTQVVLIACFLGGCDFVQHWLGDSETQDLRLCLALSVLSVGGGGRGVTILPSSLWAVILCFTVIVLLKCSHLSKLNKLRFVHFNVYKFSLQLKKA